LQTDKLVSPEFKQTLEGIMRLMFPDRQIMLFSAAFPVKVKVFRDKFLH
jgi:ATP-dependent RNA helicase DDX6/DHH1